MRRARVRGPLSNTNKISDTPTIPTIETTRTDRRSREPPKKSAAKPMVRPSQPPRENVSKVAITPATASPPYPIVARLLRESAKAATVQITPTDRKFAREFGLQRRDRNRGTPHP